MSSVGLHNHCQSLGGELSRAISKRYHTPASIVTDAFVAHEGWPKGLEEGDDPCKKTLEPSLTLCLPTHSKAKKSPHHLKEQHVPVIKCFGISVLSGWS